MGARQEYTAKELRGVVPLSLRRMERILREEIADLERELSRKRFGLAAIWRERDRQRQARWKKEQLAKDAREKIKAQNLDSWRPRSPC